MAVTSEMLIVVAHADDDEWPAGRVGHVFESVVSSFTAAPPLRHVNSPCLFSGEDFRLRFSACVYRRHASIISAGRR